MNQDFMEGSRKRRSEARMRSESTLVSEMEEIRNRYMSRNKDRN